VNIYMDFWRISLVVKSRYNVILFVQQLISRNLTADCYKSIKEINY